MDSPPVPVQGCGPVLALTDVDTDEDADVVHLHDTLLRSAGRGRLLTTSPAPTLRKTSPPVSGGGSFPLSAVTRRRTTAGDNTPRIIR